MVVTLAPNFGMGGADGTVSRGHRKVFFFFTLPDAKKGDLWSPWKHKKHLLNNKVVDLSRHFRKESVTDWRLRDLKIVVKPPGFGGLDFSGQICNPEY